MAPDDASGWAVPSPPFKPEEALVALRRQLRELKPLAERGTRYELRGQPVIELAAVEGRIDVRLARRPARSPQWQAVAIRSSAEQRDFVARVKRELARWEQDE